VQWVPPTLSRGALPLAFLSTPAPPKDYLASVAASDMQYGGYNLICGDLRSRELWHRNNRGGAAEKLPPGLHAVCNGQRTDQWPKIRKGEALVTPLLAGIGDGGEVPWEALFEAMSDRERVSDPAKVQVTGFDPALEQQFSSIFVQDMQLQVRARPVLAARPPAPPGLTAICVCRARTTARAARPSSWCDGTVEPSGESGGAVRVAASAATPTRCASIWQSLLPAVRMQRIDEAWRSWHCARRVRLLHALL